MAYQKLQVGLGVNVIPSDTINIPNVAGPTESGSATSTSANNLVDTAATFTDNLVGYIVYNTTDNTVATVNSITDANTLVLSANIMASGENYTLYADDNAGCVLYVGGAGNLRVLTSSGSDITFTGVLAGSFIPVQVKKVFATSNTASSILALW
jgi:hypothetical protein